MKKILVTGANGFLGANLVKALFRLGYEVRAMVRPHASLEVLTGIPCEIFYGHIDNPAAVQAAVAGCHYVVHAAAITDQWHISPEDYERINFTATKYVAEACMRSAVKKLVYVSTANTIGPGTANHPGTELNGFTLFKANSAYIATKYLAQQYLLEQAERSNLPVVIVNPAFMIGPNDSKPSSGKLLLYAMRKGIKFYPPGGKNFVYIDDVCRGIIRAIDHGKTGSCYLLAAHNMSYKDFFKLVSKTGGASGVFIPLPGLLIKLVALAATVIGKIVRRPPKLTYSMAFLACLPVYYSGKKAEKDLGIQYTPIEEAVRRSLQWFRENEYY
jgi:dihydroflavonol-4-reductase